MILRWKNRKRRRYAQHSLRHARHVLHMREDLLDAGAVAEIESRMTRLQTAMHQHAASDELDAATAALLEYCGKVIPTRSFPGLRENLEVFVVAVAVAMACRTYFVQPFKIPTGSMQPTLNGILHVGKNGPGVMDRYPQKLLKWAVTGAWYFDVRIKEGGRVTPDPRSMYGLRNPFSVNGGSRVSYYVGNRRYDVARDGAIPIEFDTYLPAGTVVWRGVRTAGDHVFVDKVRWNFARPKRGQVIVFNTSGIPTLPPKTHYIKRLVGMPNERVAIDPPDLVINGNAVTNTPSITRIARTRGYQLVRQDHQGMDRGAARIMSRSREAYPLGPTEYFACGDNTGNSRDSRYWGAVPRQNLVGPATIVYWPFSSHWGWIR